MALAAASFADGPVSGEQIDKYLADQDLGPGDRLPSERELSALLGVSRPSLREAIKSLQAEGRLSVRHGQGDTSKSLRQVVS